MIVLCGKDSAIQLYFFPAPVNNITDCFHFDYSGAFAMMNARPE